MTTQDAELSLANADPEVARLQWELMAMPQEFTGTGDIVRGLAGTGVECITNPGLADTLLAEVKTLGHRDRFPRPYDWENLLPQLELGEELLWIAEKKGGKCSLYFGVKFGTDDPSSKISLGEPARRRKRLAVLTDAMARRCFPESSLSLMSAEEVVAKLETASRNWGKQVTCVAGVPSPKEIDSDRLIVDRDEEKRPFASLNDVMEALIEETDFSIVFSLSKASSSEVLDQFKAKAALRDEVRPWIKGEIAKNWSHSEESSKQQAMTQNDGTQSAEQRGLGPRLFQSIFGTQDKPVSGTAAAGGGMVAGIGSGASIGAAVGSIVPGVGNVVGMLAGGAIGAVAGGSGGWWGNRQGWGRAAVSRIQSTTTTIGETTGETQQQGGSVSRTQMNTLLEYLDNSLDASMKHLQMAMGIGGFYGCVMIYTDEPDRSRRIGKTVAAVLSGRHSHLRPMQIMPFSGEGCMFQLNRRIATHALLAKGGVFLEPLDCEQAGRLLLLPDAELPGLGLRRSVFYGRPDMRNQEKLGIRIGTLAFARKTIDNRLDVEDSPNIQDRGIFSLTEKDLYSHLLLAGTTGSGKTKRAAYILNNIPARGHRLLILETAKKTYRNLLRREGRVPRVYTLGDSRTFPFRINPFCFDAGTSLKQHISVLSDALSELLPTEALIGPKLREAAEMAYRRYGWDIETGRYLRSGAPKYPSMIDFSVAVNEVCKTLDDYGPEVRANYKGALLNRARIFIGDVYQDIFAFDGDYSIADFLAEDVIIEMEEMPPSEINMPAFIIALLLQRVRAYRCLVQQESDRLGGVKCEAGREHLVKNPPVVLVIEEAHNVLHRKFEQERSETEAGKGKRLVEQVGRLMMEGRSLGIGLMVVDQSPKNLSDAVITNANTKIVFRQEDGDEVKAIGTAMGVNEKDWPDLQRLAVGECVVKSSVWTTPVKLAGLTKEEYPDEVPHAINARDKVTMPYGEVLQLLGESRNGFSPPPSAAAELAKRILYLCRDDFALIRFLMAKHWIEKGAYSRACAAESVENYGDLKRYLAFSAKPEPAMSEFLVVFRAILSEPFEKRGAEGISEIRERGTLELLTGAGKMFLVELERVVARRSFGKIPEGLEFYPFRNAVNAWIEAIKVGEQCTGEVTVAIRKTVVPLQDAVNGLLATIME